MDNRIRLTNTTHHRGTMGSARSPKMILRAGYIRKPYYRKGYVRKNGVVVRSAHIESVEVPAKWIKMRGKPGKTGKWTEEILGRKPIKITHPGTLGYSFSDPVSFRHGKLDQAVRKYGYGDVFRKVNAIRVLSKYTSPKTSAAANADIQYIRGKYSGGEWTSKKKKSKKRKTTRRRRS